MPFTEDGIIPDMIMNPHSFPTRMTISQVYESSLGNIGATLGTMFDGTTFRQYDNETIIETARKHGLEPYGRRRLYSGYDGNWIDALIFTGPTYYQRLQKFVAKSIYSIDIGPTDIITHQPLDGKGNQGGLRLSELQRDVILAQGVARFLSEKFFTDSDDFEIQICRCGTFGIVNTKMGIYECKNCGDNAEICSIYSSWTAKQFLYEIKNIGVGLKFTLNPYTFYSQ